MNGCLLRYCMQAFMCVFLFYCNVVDLQCCIHFRYKQGKSVIYIHMPTLFSLDSLPTQAIMEDWVPCYIQQFLLVIYFIYSSLLLFFRFIHSFFFFLDSTYNGYHMIFIFLCLTYFTQYNISSSIHVTVNGTFVLFYGLVILHYMYVLHLLKSFLC